MRHSIVPLLVTAVLIAGCATRKTPDMSPYYPATAALREDTIARSVRTNVPFGSLYELGIYIVQPSDTLDRVLARFHLTAQELASRNGCEADSPHIRKLLVGQRLVIYERISQ
jgi:LysM repeat protein